MFRFLAKLDTSTNEYYFDKLHLEHNNHEVSEEAFGQHLKLRKLNDPEVERYVSDYLINAKMSKKQLKDKIHVETGKCVSLENLQNYKVKLNRERNRKLVKMEQSDPW